jgi:hypothetical protein
LTIKAPKVMIECGKYEEEMCDDAMEFLFE